MQVRWNSASVVLLASSNLPDRACPETKASCVVAASSIGRWVLSVIDDDS